MAPPLQAIVLAASSMLMIVVSCSAQLAELASPSITTAFSAPLHLASPAGLYKMEFSIGGTKVCGVIDTGSNLIWTSNSQLFDSPVSCPCVGGKEMGKTCCPFEAGKEMGMTCCDGLPTFKLEYGDGASHVRGVMGEAKLTFELGKPNCTTPALNIGSAIMFGCHLKDNGANMACKAYERGGIVGLGRGELSLVSQLNLHTFSYCLPDLSSASSQQATGQIKFNDDIADPLKDRKKISLVKINKPYPESSRYYVVLKDIEIGTRKMELHSDCTKKEERGYDDEGMMIIDSGSPASRLPAEAFEAIKQHMQEKMTVQPKENKQGDLCYDTTTSPENMDKMVLTFCGGSQMEIPYFFKDKTADKICLTIKPQEKQLLLGAYQQQGMHMLFNIQDNTLSFAKHSGCGPSQEENRATI